MGKEITRHNELFQKIIGDLAVARAFFQAYLPQDIQQEMDFSTLEMVRLNSEWVRDTLDKRDIADALFQVQLKGQPAYLLVHAEHQSTINHLTLLRTIQYGVTGLLDYARLNPDAPLPPIISLIYYHGQQRTTSYPTTVEELLAKEHQHYAPYLFQPVFIDVGQLSDEALAQHGAMSGLDLLFKHIFDRPTPELLTQLLGSLAHNSGDIQYYRTFRTDE
ncbi:MAG: Rpn family recombination-promoting nuclease/putative transposase [Gammaproteobacteria bacterium]|nr:Rpn family recombination-promoting nuclease/putative transposase [Gammaproteobacteria bacterium]